jgi:2-polyprenyl-3-methyl-5-hydroxy-6-metoxy-1,4-benzoquinol methylase
VNRYEIKPSEFSSHSTILRSVGQSQGGQLLDVGCADGQMSARFTQLGWQVTGIEPHPVDARKARELGIRVLELTLEEAVGEVQDRFEIVVLADVLEHCADPWQQLAQIASLCEPRARIVISVPNIAHVLPRMQLLMGRFDYEDRGIMDRTHLRFFTRRTALEMVSRAGLYCETLHVTPTPIELVLPQLSSRFGGASLLAINARASKLVPRLLGYQFVMVCRFPDHELDAAS